jgi:hypothetical protein
MPPCGGMKRRVTTTFGEDFVLAYADAITPGDGSKLDYLADNIKYDGHCCGRNQWLHCISTIHRHGAASMWMISPSYMFGAEPRPSYCAH